VTLVSVPRVAVTVMPADGSAPAVPFAGAIVTRGASAAALALALALAWALALAAGLTWAE